MSTITLVCFLVVPAFGQNSNGSLFHFGSGELRRLVEFEFALDQSDSGMILHETKEVISLATTAGKTVELRAEEIEERSQQNASLMPDNLADELTVEEFRNLLALLERFWPES